MRSVIWSNLLRLSVLTILLLPNARVVGLLIPPSFSFDHKSSFEGNVSLAKVLELVSQYEVDSHVEVILVGRRFGGKQASILMDRLESLSRISAFSSPLSHVHEKIVYHVSSDSGLEVKLEQLILSHEGYYGVDEGILIVNPNIVATTLEEYHDKASTATSLFVLDVDVHNSVRPETLSKEISTTGKDSRQNYTYQSHLESCSRRAYIGKKDFAWLDLSANGDILTPGASSNGRQIGEVLPPVIDQYRWARKEEQVSILASLLHRSAEGFYQFPAHLPVSSVRTGSSTSTSQYYSRRVAALLNSIHHSFPPSTLDVAVITICLPGATDNGECKADPATQRELQILSEMYQSPSLRIRSDVLSYDLTSEPQLAHAFYASLTVGSLDNSNSNSNSGEQVQVSILRTGLLMQWLSSCSLVQELVDNYGGRYDTEAGKEYLPIFVFKGGPLDTLFLDRPGSTTKHVPFPEPPGGSYSESSHSHTTPGHASQSRDHVHSYTSTAADRAQAKGNWPAVAVVAVRSGGSAAFEEEPLWCGGNVVPPPKGAASLLRARNEMRDSIKQAVWGIPPAHTHYSGASRSQVRDYLWHVPPLLSTSNLYCDSDAAGPVEECKVKVDSHISFLDRRVVSRHAFINKAEGILRHLSSMLVAAQSAEPPVDVAFLLDLPRDDSGDSSSSSSSTMEAGSTANTAFDTSPSGTHKSDAKNKNRKKQTKGAFTSDGLLAEFLRLMDRASNDFSHVDYDSAMANLGKALEHVEKMEERLERLVLSRSATVFCEHGARTPYEDAEGSAEGGDPSSVDTDASDGGEGLLGWALLFGAVFMGTTAGNAVKDRLRKRKRRAYL